MDNCNLKIKDTLQTTFDLSQYIIIRDIILLVSIYFFYTNSSYDTFVIFVKYYILMLILRWIISNITSISIDVEGIENEKNNKKYFQISGHMMAFTLLILLCIDNNLFGLSNNLVLVYALIISYSLLNIFTKSHYSYDILTTVLLTYSIYNLSKNVKI
jgi:hypothetical protein